MTFVSLSLLAAKSGRMVQGNHVTVTQTKRSTGGIELCFRMSKTVMEKTGIAVGNRADILFDESSSRWMIKIINDGGFGVSGQKNKGGEYSSCAVRLTVRPGFPRLSDDDEATVKRLSKDSLSQMEAGQIVFTLSEE